MFFLNVRFLSYTFESKSVFFRFVTPALISLFHQFEKSTTTDWQTFITKQNNNIFKSLSGPTGHRLLDKIFVKMHVSNQTLLADLDTFRANKEVDLLTHLKVNSIRHELKNWHRWQKVALSRFGKLTPQVRGSHFDSIKR